MGSLTSIIPNRKFYTFIQRSTATSNISTANGTEVATITPRVVDLKFDALISEEFEADADITSHPVENGANISDNIVLKPKTLTLSGKISSSSFVDDDPLKSLVQGVGVSAAAYLATTALGQIATAASALGAASSKSIGKLIDSKSDLRITHAIDELIAIRDAKQPVAIQTGMRQYGGKQNERFYLQKASFKRDKSNGGNSVNVTLTLQEVVLTSAKYVDVPYPKKVSGGTKSHQGKQETKPTPDQTGPSSVLSKLFGIKSRAGK